MMVTLGAVFLSVALLAGVIAWFVMSGSSQGQRRLTRLSRPRTKAAPVIVEEAALAEVPDPEWNRLLETLPTSRVTVKRLRREMAMAGFTTARAAAMMSLAELVLPFVFAVPPLLLLDGPNRWVG